VDFLLLSLQHPWTFAFSKAIMHNENSTTTPDRRLPQLMHEIFKKRPAVHKLAALHREAGFKALPSRQVKQSGLIKVEFHIHRSTVARLQDEDQEKTGRKIKGQDGPPPQDGSNSCC